MKKVLSSLLIVCILLSLLPTLALESQAACGTTGGNLDIILVLDHSNSMYPPTSDNATYLGQAIEDFLEIAFASNNAANNKIAIVQYDSLGRAWDGSEAVLYNYSMTLSDYSTLTYANCFMNTSAKVNAAVTALMTTPDSDYTMGGMTNTMGGLRMTELVASTRSTSTTRDLLIVMFTDGLPTCRYFTSTKDWYWDGNGNATSAWEYTRALEAGQSLRKCVDKYTNCESTIYNIALLNSSDLTSQDQKIADYFMSNTTNYMWTYDTTVNSDNYQDLREYVDSQSTYFKTKTAPWADCYQKLFSATDFVELCNKIATEYTTTGYAEHQLSYSSNGDTHTATCANCDYTVTESHTLGSWSVTTAATCTSAGIETATCSVCKHSVTRELSKLSHTVVIDPAVAPSCDQIGWTEGSHCSICGTTIVAQQQLEALSHDYVAVITPPSCESDGYTTYTCKNCPISYADDYIFATGHDYIATITAATCTSAGYTTYTCKDCNLSYADNTVDPLGHDYVAIVTPPSCTEQGYTTYTCLGCSESYTDRYTSPVDHDYIAEVTAPTCSSIGFTTYTCSQCNESYQTDYVPALSHDYVAVVTAPTCTEQGYTTYTCLECTDSYNADFTPAAGHSYDDGVYTTEPTCTSDGVMLFTCACGDSYTEVVTGAGHDLIFYPATAATCNTDGNKAYYQCISCETAFIDDTCEYPLPLQYFILSASGHTYVYTNNGKTHTAACSVCSAAATPTHTVTDGTCICGAEESEIPEYAYDPSLTLTVSATAGVEMGVSYTIMATNVASYTDFYLVVSKSVADSTPIVVTYGIGADREALTSKTHPTTGQVVMYNATFSGINAKEMGDEISATLFAVDEYGTTYYGPVSKTSIKDYLLGRINNAASIAELKTMAVDMLKYGAAAQLRLGYNTDELVTKDLTAEQLSYATQELPKATNYIKSLGNGNSLSASITVNERVRLNLSCVYTPGDTSELTYLIIDTDSAEMIAELPVTVKGNAFCTGTFDNIGAKQMRRKITVALYDGTTIVSQFLVWSVESYVAQIREKADVSAEELNMANALLTYGDSVAAYMSAIGQ